MLMTKTSAAVAVAAMCATLQGASADSARYIRIYHLADSPAQILNLDEVMPYGEFARDPSSMNPRTVSACVAA